MRKLLENVSSCKKMSLVVGKYQSVGVSGPIVSWTLRRIIAMKNDSSEGSGFECRL